MMNQQEIFRKIGNILTELQDQYKFLAQNPEKLSDLEVELFLANANFLSDHVQIIKKLNHLTSNTFKTEELPKAMEVPVQVEPTEPVHTEVLEEIVQAENEEERVDIQPALEIVEEEEIHKSTAEELLKHDFFKPDQEQHTFEFVLGNHSEDDKFDFEEQSADEIFDRPLSKAEEEILEQKRRMHLREEVTSQEEEASLSEDEIGPEPFLIHTEEEKPAEVIESLKGVELDEAIISPPVLEKPLFTPEAVPLKPIAEPVKASPSLNDLLAKTNAKEETQKGAPISDLKQSINLNEKLLFIKDLFGGYNLAYSEAIDLVNKMNSFDAADIFLQSNYAVKNNWAAKQATVDQFYELLNRRFSQ